ncbi:hypothetical protein WUBG_17141 [Wuchereria bancrofti]|uniref:Uncharacterized protein n=1 Tax=Wuchereria bancrofti TaxID=6293 RepID=J9DQW5_WUCBA|nr:hypothetical protein WUBG_17141 [Wuchereria bancrofti]VDM17773.1 unnamed protein product [Wuchereria bancrofti]
MAEAIPEVLRPANLADLLRNSVRCRRQKEPYTVEVNNSIGFAVLLSPALPHKKPAAMELYTLEDMCDRN